MTRTPPSLLRRVPTIFAVSHGFGELLWREVIGEFQFVRDGADGIEVMGVAATAPGLVVTLGELRGHFVVTVTADFAVEDFDDVYVIYHFQQGRAAVDAGAFFIEGMGHIHEAALRVNGLHGLQGRHARLHGFAHKQSHDIAVPCADLLTDNHLYFFGDVAQFQRAL